MVRRLIPIVVALALTFGAGLRVGAAFRQPAAQASRLACVATIVEDLEGAEKVGAAAVTIINEMVMGRASSDETSMVFLRDSMQEMTTGLGNVRTQIEALRSPDKPMRCTAAR